MPTAKTRFIIYIAIAVVAVVVIGYFTVSSITQANNSPEKLLSLGEKFLSELKYEEALVQFLKVIEIEPMNERAYLAAAEAYIGLGQTDHAIEILRHGLEQIPDSSSILKILDELLYERQRETLTSEATPILIELASLCYRKDYETVFEKMQTDYFIKVAELSGFLDRPHIIDTLYGKIGVYEVNSEKYGNYMIYYGSYSGEARDGSGVWLGSYKGQNYFANGSWKDDMPNGEMQIREWHSALAEDVTYRIITGNAVNGLWNGDATWAFEHGSEPADIFPVQFDMGHWVVIEVDDDNDDGITRYIVSKSGNTNDDNTGVMSTEDDYANTLQGIIGYGD